jgi:MazG family protein
MQELLSIMRRLRDPETGCPWDVEQTFASLVPHTLEEAYEVADAVERGSPKDLEGELGDLLLQVVFYAQIATEAGLFSFEDIAGTLADKLVQRHPHVFGDAEAANAEEVVNVWEAVKEKERAGQSEEAKSALDGVTRGLPALTRAVKLQKRAAKHGFDWEHVGQVLDKLHEEVAELEEELDGQREMERLEHELGDVLFSVANIARHLKVDPEQALRRCNERFISRFQHVEKRLVGQKQMAACTLQELMELWEEAKKQVD